MKPLFAFSTRRLLGCASASLTSLASLHLLAAGTVPGPAPLSPTNAPGTVAVTNGVALDESIPQSIFVVPRKPEEGRDPFFPTSLRLFGVNPASTNRVSIPTAAVLDLRLKGISGPTNRRLALINNHTFEAGENADVTAGGRRVRIQCLQINDASVLIEVSGERRELRLRNGF